MMCTFGGVFIFFSTIAHSKQSLIRYHYYLIYSDVLYLIRVGVQGARNYINVSRRKMTMRTKVIRV